MPGVKHVLVLVALTACERAPDRDPAPEPASLPAGGILESGKPAPSVPRPAPSFTPSEVDRIIDRNIAYEEPPPLVPGPLAPPRVATVHAATGELPVPPSIDPGPYMTWLRALPADQRLQVNQFCRAHPYDFNTSCGGIGHLHIPMPPHGDVDEMMSGHATPGLPRSAFTETQDWVASLTPRQRAFYQRECVDANEGMPHSNLCGPNTPLVLSFDAAPVTFMSGGTFAFQPGAPTATDWPTAATPWIALDVDGDGAITSGAELFGSETRLPDGSRATHGFTALAQHDSNRDGVIDRRDPVFASLLVWADRNGDQHSSADELSPLSSQVTEIALDYIETQRCDARANCEGQRAAFTWRDPRGTHTGAVVDVYLPRRPM